MRSAALQELSDTQAPEFTRAFLKDILDKQQSSCGSPCTGLMLVAQYGGNQTHMAHTSFQMPRNMSNSLKSSLPFAPSALPETMSVYQRKERSGAASGLLDLLTRALEATVLGEAHKGRGATSE